jgi:hypothetical protein
LTLLSLPGVWGEFRERPLLEAIDERASRGARLGVPDTDACCNELVEHRVRQRMCDDVGTSVRDELAHEVFARGDEPDEPVLALSC